ncbi:MAG: LamG-like jellyroll fold domain-containing protein [Verrucomicrobiales bacterium]|nr:LamG-like jellyroll fold domain-containing protein [Verrucomicrobiota bacterium JB025]
MKAVVPFILAALAMSAAAAAPPDGLVLHFPFDQAGAESSVPDRSGHDNHGKRVGGRWLADGKSGGALQFWGKNCHLGVAASDSLDLAQGTIALWFNTDRSQRGGFSLVHRMAGGRGIALGFSGDSEVKFSRGRIGFSIDGCPPVLSDHYLADGSWHHAAATFDGKTLRLFIDGVAQKQSAGVPVAAVGSSALPITIGASPETVKAKRAFQGMLDEVMIFNRPLAAEEIKAMVDAVDPDAAKPRFTKKQIEGRLRQLKQLFDEGLLTREFYDRKVDECNMPVN